MIKMLAQIFLGKEERFHKTLDVKNIEDFVKLVSNRFNRHTFIDQVCSNAFNIKGLAWNFKKMEFSEVPLCFICGAYIYKEEFEIPEEDRNEEVNPWRCNK